MSSFGVLPRDYYGNIYRIRIDGSELTLLFDDGYCMGIELIDDWVYFLIEGDDFRYVLYRMNTDGTNKQLIG